MDSDVGQIRKMFPLNSVLTSIYLLSGRLNGKEHCSHLVMSVMGTEQESDILYTTHLPSQQYFPVEVASGEKIGVNMCLGFPFPKQTYQKPKGHDTEGMEYLSIAESSYLQLLILSVMNLSEAIHLSFIRTLPEIIQDIFISNIRIRLWTHQLHNSRLHYYLLCSQFMVF